MKAIFPCTGSLILTKIDAQSFKDFYNKKPDSIEGFNYLDADAIVLDEDAAPKSVDELKRVLGITSDKAPETQGNISQDDDNFIDDESIATNPFFTTLRPVDEGE